MLSDRTYSIKGNIIIKFLEDLSEDFDVEVFFEDGEINFSLFTTNSEELE